MIADQVDPPEAFEAFYRRLLPAIRDAGWECGYAIGVHGTLRRDLDLIAAPWIPHAAAPKALADRVAEATGGTNHGAGVKPHGRLAFTIVLWDCRLRHSRGWAFIDLSVMPRAEP